MKTEKILIRGEKLSASVSMSTDVLEHQSSFIIRGSTRGVSEAHTVEVEDNSVIELVFEDNTTWLCNQNTIDELFPEATASRAAGQIVEIPLVLQSSDLERGLISNVIVKVINIFTKKKVGLKVRELASKLEQRQLENTIGLFGLTEDFKFQKRTLASSADPFLLFIHGTASSTRGSYGDLLGTDVWGFMHKTYGGRVLAFQHESLTKSPLNNLVDLVTALPTSCTLHIITQSRGGLVGELLARFFNSNENQLGFTEEEIALLDKEDRKDDVKAIRALQKLAAKKKIRIEKFIRSACPGGGTTLASKRLDHLLNMTFNLIGAATGLGANPVYGAFKNLISAVIDSKNDVDLLPGLESMNPKSPFIEALNYPGSSIEIDNSLVIISGNCKAKLNLKGLLIIATKLFYRHDNDLIVDTESMYAGTRRKGMVQYCFDEGTEVDHFNYFKNERTRKALFNALQLSNDTLLPDFAELDTNLAEAQRGVLLGLDGGQVFREHVSGSKPILVVLPGIMGSNLEQGKKLVWINYGRFLAGELRRLDISSNGIGAPSLIKTSYGKLVDRFSFDYDVVTFPYDWRLQLRTRADLFNKKIKELMKFNQPIRIIGHSMGGVLVRDFMVFHPETWTQLNSSKGFRLVFLGAPLGGSHRIPAVLFGQDSLINKLSKIDIVHSKKDLLKIFSKLPGLLSLLPHGKDMDFAEAKTWTTMLEGAGDPSWPVPKDNDLAEFGKYRDDIQDSLDEIDYSNIVYIAGHDKETPCGVRIDESASGKELVFLSTSEGDQSVTWESGIPKKMITNNSVYYTDIVHGALAAEPRIFDGIADLLANGRTNLISQTRPITRGSEKIFRSTIAEDFDLSMEGVEKTILGISKQSERKQPETPIRTTVTNGDLKYARFPVLLGHFESDGILYAEESIDKLLNYQLRQLHALGLYPGRVGTSEVLMSPGSFPGAVIVGLGNQGSLTAWQLQQTVEQGVARYLAVLNSKDNVSKQSGNGISSLAIGCGYGGLTVENSVRAIVHGVMKANEKIKILYNDNCRTIEFVEFVEQYSDRAVNCLYALNKMETEFEFNVPVVIGQKKIINKPGSKERLPGDSSGQWWTRINVQLADYNDVKNEKLSPSARVVQNFRFSISTGGAREELRNLYSSKEIIDRLIEEISTNHRWTPELAKTFFELVIPFDFKERLKKQGNFNWVVDKTTAGYPWELLQDMAVNAKPLSVSGGMLRQLATADSSLRNPVSGNKALVIADPQLGGFLNQLPGAEREGKYVIKKFDDNNYDTSNSLIGGTSAGIIQQLYKDGYKIIHLAGHGFFDREIPESSGMVIGNNAFLSTREIQQMSSVPELVFINCCFLGKTDGVTEEFYRYRYRMAANLGVQLIENGVRAVIAAGWEVNDEAALKFTEVFYDHMFNNYPFGEAVQKARAAVYAQFAHNNNTWGAYQCYGDPYYQLTKEGGARKKRSYDFVIPEQAVIELNNLSSEINMGGGKVDEYQANLAAISEAVDRAGLRLDDGRITEKEAVILGDLYDYDNAVQKFKTLREFENADFSMSAMEYMCLAKGKAIMIRCSDVVSSYQESMTNISATEKRKLEVSIRKARKEAINRTELLIEEVEQLLAVGKTAERYLMMGHCYWHIAALQDTRKSILDSYAVAAYYYSLAYDKKNSNYRAYGLVYWMEVEGVLVAAGVHKWGQQVRTSAGSYTLPSSLKEVDKQLVAFKAAALDDQLKSCDYWQIFLPVAIDFVGLLLKPNALTVGALLGSYQNVWSKAGSPGKKRDELDHIQMLQKFLKISGKAPSKQLLLHMTDLEKRLSDLIN